MLKIISIKCGDYIFIDKPDILLIEKNIKPTDFEGRNV
jgi:hypothetical protein